MRILVLADASSPHTERWLSGLEARGHQPSLVSFQEPWDTKRQVIRLRGSGKLKYWSVGRQVRKLASEYDAVLAHFLPAYGVSAWRAGIPFVLVLWGSDILVWPFRDRPRFNIARRVLASARWIVADSLAVRRVLQLNFGYPPDRVSVFPFGPEEDALSFPLVQKDENLVIFPRALERIYSPLLAVGALGSLTKNRRDLRASFTMSGRMKEECRSLADRLGISAEFAGPLPRRDYLGKMASAGIYLSLALSDATPVSLLEAMALGAFPIASDLPAIREWIIDGLNGLLVDPRSLERVVSALERALDDPELSGRAREINGELIRDRGPWTNNLRGLAEILTGLKDMKPPTLSMGQRKAFWSYL